MSEHEEHEKKLTCIHEAAHAVAFSLLLNGVQRISLGEGECRFQTVTIGFDTVDHVDGFIGCTFKGDGEAAPFDITTENARKHFVCALAGPIAHAAIVNRVGGQRPIVLGDLHSIFALANMLKFSEEELSRTLGEAFTEANVFVAENFPHIDRVARRLYTNKTLTGDQVLAEIAEVEVHK